MNELADSRKIKGIIKKEGEFFSHHDNLLTRQTAWSSIPYFQQKMRNDLDLIQEAKKIITKSNIAALTIACGDMMGEYSVFKKLNATNIDAFDVAWGKREDFFAKIYDNSIPVTYKIADANELQLKKKYDVVYMQQSLHHINSIDYLLREISEALNPNGIFLLNDYIGPNFLQRSERQKKYAKKIWAMLPERLRINPQGKILPELFVPKKEWLSPCEAVNSEAILPALYRFFDVYKISLVGGILFPIFNGFAQNYTDYDNLFVHAMWEFDKALIENELVEPNFVRAILRPKNLVSS